MGTAIKHPVPDRVKPSVVIFDIRALCRSVLGVRGQSIQMSKITNDGLTRSGTGHLNSSTDMATVGVKGLNRITSYDIVTVLRLCRAFRGRRCATWSVKSNMAVESLTTMTRDCLTLTLKSGLPTTSSPTASSSLKVPLSTRPNVVEFARCDIKF